MDRQNNFFLNRNSLHSLPMRVAEHQLIYHLVHRSG